MNNYLLFRTDRIGDFLLSAILLKAIKRNDPNAHISVVCSSKNFNYIKNFHLVDEAILSGTTTLEIVSKLRSAGAKIIHIRIPFPVVSNACVANNMPNTGILLTELLTKNKDLKGKTNHDFEKYLGADTVQFLNEKEFLGCFVNTNSKCVKCIA